MGDFHELQMQGVLCSSCGTTMEDQQATGHPRYCKECVAAKRTARQLRDRCRGDVDPKRNPS